MLTVFPSGPYMAKTRVSASFHSVVALVRLTWPEGGGRATGARLEKLKSGGSVKTARGELALLFEDTNQKLAAKIGSCGT